MQLNQKQQKFEVTYDITESPNPDHFLLQLFSTLTKHNHEHHHLCSLHLHHLTLRKQILNMMNQIQLIRETIKFHSAQTTPKRNNKQINPDRHQSSLYSNQNTVKPKRARRAANEIKRHFQCPVQNCQKQYGSQGSLNQHIKTKHQALYQNLEFRVVSAQSDSKYSQ